MNPYPRTLEGYFMAIDANRERLFRSTGALDAAGIPYAVIGGWAVAS